MVQSRRDRTVFFAVINIILLSCGLQDDPNVFFSFSIKKNHGDITIITVRDSRHHYSQLEIPIVLYTAQVRFVSDARDPRPSRSFLSGHVSCDRVLMPFSHHHGSNLRITDGTLTRHTVFARGRVPVCGDIMSAF